MDLASRTVIFAPEERSKLRRATSFALTARDDGRQGGKASVRQDRDVVALALVWLSGWSSRSPGSVLGWTGLLANPNTGWRGDDRWILASLF